MMYLLYNAHALLMEVRKAGRNDKSQILMNEEVQKTLMKQGHIATQLG